VLNPHGRYHGVSSIVLDSIQRPGLSANNLAAWQSLIQFFALTRAAQVLTLAVCHITKRGEIAGPKALEHAVDATILIRKAYNRGMIRWSAPNRWARDNAAASLPIRNIAASLPRMIYGKTIMAGGSTFWDDR
jgi:hypothetical protein